MYQAWAGKKKQKTKYAIITIINIQTIYEVCPESIQLCIMKNRHLLKKIQETLYIGQWHLNPLQSRHLGTSHSSQVFVDCNLYMFNILRCSACCRPSRMWITFNRFSTIFEVFVPYCYLCCTHCIVPEGLLNHPNSFRRETFKINAKFDAELLLYLLILNGMATQYTCSLNSLYHPYWLVQWSHCSSKCIPVHSPWLPGYTNITTIPVILTMAVLFPDRPCIHSSFFCKGSSTFFYLGRAWGMDLEFGVQMN